MIKLGFLISSALYLSLIGGCSTLFERRTFSKEMNLDSERFWLPGIDFKMAAGDTGQAFRSHREVMKRTPKNSYQSKLSARELFLEQELSRRLSQLNEKNYIRFGRYEDRLNSTSEKIYLLSMSPTFWREYMATKTISNRDYNPNKKVTMRTPASLQKRQWMPKNQVYIGMNKDAVIQNWGRPDRIDMGQNPDQQDEQNERWSFYEGGKVRHIFFDRDNVSSWAAE